MASLAKVGQAVPPAQAGWRPAPHALLFLVVLLSGAILGAQTTCPATPTYSACDIAFDLNDTEAAAHANPYLTVELHAEFRSPRHRTFLLPAFWDGGRRM